MNISTGQHFKVLIKITSAIDIVMYLSNIRDESSPPKWTSLHMQLIIDIAAENTLGCLRFKANAPTFN